MENRARLTGYAVALFLLAALLAMISLLQNGLVARHNYLRVSFPKIGTLIEDDPVKVRGVEIGRVARIQPSPHGALGDGNPVVTLELYRSIPLPEDTRFVNYNYSLFGARMVVAVPGRSSRPLDAGKLQPGLFAGGVSESIHKVDELLRTVLEYQGLSERLQNGDDSSMSLQQLLSTRIYPALGEIGRFSRELETLQASAGPELDRLGRAAERMNRLGRAMGPEADTLLSGAHRTLDQLTRLTAQSAVLVRSLEQMLVSAQDTTKGPGRLLAQRDQYDRFLAMAHGLQDMLKLLRRQGLHDIISFRKNVRLRSRPRATAP